MPTIREDLHGRICQELRAGLRTPVPSQEIDQLADSIVDRVGQWLENIYDDRSVSYQVFGEAAPTVARPSFEWLRESMKA